MELFYQPNDVNQLEKENAYWRKKAKYKKVSSLFFGLNRLDFNLVLTAHLAAWQRNNALNYRSRFLDYGKYYWISIDPQLDQRPPLKVSITTYSPLQDQTWLPYIRKAPLPTYQDNSNNIKYFEYIGLLIRRYTIISHAHTSYPMAKRVYGKVALPIPIPVERDKQQMEQLQASVRATLITKFEADRLKSPNERAYLSKNLELSTNRITRRALFFDIMNSSFESGTYSRPQDLGKLLGEIDYFGHCWREFHEAEQAPVAAHSEPVTNATSAPESGKLSLLQVASPLQNQEKVTDTCTETTLEGFLADKCSLALCDKAAKKAGLSVDNSAKTHPNLRVHALAAALKETYSLGTSIEMNAFRSVLATHYGVSIHNPKYRPQHGKGTGQSQRIQKWDDVYDSARFFLTNHYKQERCKK